MSNKIISITGDVTCVPNVIVKKNDTPPQNLMPGEIAIPFSHAKFLKELYAEPYQNFMLPYNFLQKRKGYSQFNLVLEPGLGTLQKEINELYDMIQNNNRTMTIPGLKVGCDHTWKQYQGFTENYEYCSKCDLKK
jgi:hypothetical protein